MDKEVNKRIQFGRPQCWYYWKEWFMKYTDELALDGIILRIKFHDYWFGNSGNIKVITSTIWEAAVLVLLTGSIHDVCHWDDLTWHDIVTTFHKDWYRRSSNNLNGCNVGITEGRDFINCAVKLGSGAMIYLSSFIKTCSGVHKLLGCVFYIQQGDVKPYFYFSKVRKVGLKH
jgi:hypothetical protein